VTFPVRQASGPRPRRGGSNRRRRSSGVLGEHRRGRGFGGGRHRRCDPGLGVVSWFQSELFDEVIEVEQSRRVELRLLDGGASLQLRRRQRRLAVDFAAAVPADWQLPVFERLLTVWTTLHGSSRTAMAAAGVDRAMPVPPAAARGLSMPTRGSRFAGGSPPSAVPRSAITEASRDADVRRRQGGQGPKGELLPMARTAQDRTRQTRALTPGAPVS
jgi:hypothetical protein